MGSLHAGVNGVITAFNELWQTGIGSLAAPLTASAALPEVGSPLQCEHGGFEMLHLPSQLGRICNAVASAVKLGPVNPDRPLYSATFS